MNYFGKPFILLVCVLFVFNACKKDNTVAELLTFELIDHEAEVIINNAGATVLITFNSTVTNADNVKTEIYFSEGASASIDDINISSGINVFNFEAPFYINILAEDEINQLNYIVKSINNNYTDDWGLGGFEKTSCSNNRTYSWYLDQSITGKYSGVNCGPTSTTMAAKWANQNYNKTPEDARAAYRPEGGWWYTSDIDAYLTDNQIQHYYIGLANSSSETAQILTNQLDQGQIMIICLDMYYISNGSNPNWHVDKFYNTNAEGWGHFIIIKGYKMVDKKLFFETYDPYCYNKKYLDGTYKGKDRYYRSMDIYKATSVWWNYAIVIDADIDKSLPVNAIDKAYVPVQRGR